VANLWFVSGEQLLLRAAHECKGWTLPRGSITADAYDCFFAASKKADTELNKFYRRVQTVVDGDELVKLREAQRLWIQFRDANCSAEHEPYEGGSAGPMVKVACLEAVTRHRTEELQVMYGWRLEKWGK
jgi:uncharacterized protein YecT (DUF1311 family)